MSFTAHINAELDRRLHEDVEFAARALRLSEDGLPFWAGGRLSATVDEEEGGGHWLEVWSLGGARLLATSSLGPIDLGPPPAPDEPAHAPRTLALPSGPVRVLTETVSVDGAPFLIRAAVSEGSTRAQGRALWAELLTLSAVVLGLGGLGGYVLARRSLAPLVRMADHARRITAEQLHERLPVDGTSTELQQLRDAFNDTLARLERSFGQLKSFTADASHELRTPLTALRAVGEVGLRGARDAEGYRDVIGSMLEEVDRLSRLADELLTLARAESGEAKLHLEPLDLTALAREVAGHLSVLAEERGQALEVEADGPAAVQADRQVLRQAIVNLVDNAIKYAPERTRVRVRSGRGPGFAFVEVVDEGPGIPAEHRERVFERFYRVDKSRSREMGGTGLGLSLVKWAAEAHGGRVELEGGPDRGSTFRVVLPAAAVPVRR